MVAAAPVATTFQLLPSLSLFLQGSLSFPVVLLGPSPWQKDLPFGWERGSAIMLNTSAKLNFPRSLDLRTRVVASKSDLLLIILISFRLIVQESKVFYFGSSTVRLIVDL